MIFIVTTLYHEAKPIIDFFELKKKQTANKFQIFLDENIVLIISGIGAFSASAAVAHLLTLYQVKSSDLIINIGIGAASHSKYNIGDAVLCHKVIHHDSGRSYYPDILVQHHFKEGTLESFSQVVHEETMSKITGDIIDMEGAGFFHAASVFLPPHHIHVIKIVSDLLEPSKVTPQLVQALIQQNIGHIADYIQRIKQLLNDEKELLTEEDLQIIDRITKNLRLTATLQHQLHQLAKQYKMLTGNPFKILEPFMNIQAQTKEEGKKSFEQIRSKILYP